MQPHNPQRFGLVTLIGNVLKMMTQYLDIIFDDKKLFFASLWIILGVFLLGFFLTRDKVESKSDLIEVNGTLQDYSFTKRYENKHNSYSYYIFFREYNSTFQIIADFIDDFKIYTFKRTLKPGDRIKIAISRADYSEINNQERIKLFGISDNENTYLDFNDAIEEYNSNVLVYFSILFILMGIVTFYKQREKFIKKE